ncbi:unnamed protein product [Umbelopsis vinacea]
MGTEIGSVHILQLCPDNIQNSLSIPYAMIKCKCHYVASIALQIAMLDSESHSDVSAYIFIGGFNGEIEVISYGQLPDENDGAFGMQSTKVITTLWKNNQYAPSEDSSELYSKYISAQSDLSHLRSSRALLYILLDALGESEFQKFAENIDLDISTRHLVTDCWAIDHLKIDILHAMDRPTYMIPFPSNYLRAVKDNAGVPAALKLIKANHIRVDDITDEEVIAAYLPTLDPIDAVMALKTVGKLLAKSNKLESVLKKLVSHWFKEENRKQMTTKLMSTTVEAMLEQEVITYCSSTKPSWPNLHFLFSYYLNRNYYVEAMAVHEMLIQQDATSVVEQQRKVITDSALKLIPSIQKALSSISVDKNATVEAIPFSSLVFTHNLQSSDHEEDEPLVEQLIQQIQLLNPSNPHSNPFARPPKMAYN